MSDKDKTLCLLVAIAIGGVVLDKAVDSLYKIEKMKIECSMMVDNCESK